MKNKKNKGHDTSVNYAWVRPGEMKAYMNMDTNHFPKKKSPHSKLGFLNWFMTFYPAACRLYAYMDFRANKEFPKDEQPHTLDRHFYVDSFMKKCFKHFGVECCSECGTILCDEQNPGALSWFEEFEKRDPGKNYSKEDEAADAKRKTH